MRDDSYNENKTIEKLTKKNKPLHEGHRERLRARFDKDNEMETFADHEILEMELSLVIPRRDTNGLAHELIDHFGSLESVYRASVNELIKIKGMTTGAAYLIAMHMPLMRKTMTYADATLRYYTMNSTADAISYAHRFFIGRNTETFGLFLIDTRGHVISETIRESSSPSRVAIEVEDIVHRALREGASSVVIAHNHPSGDVSPSSEDLILAKRIYLALDAVNVTLYDSLIFYESKYFSLRSSGILGSFMSAESRKKIIDELATAEEVKKATMAGLEEFIVNTDNLGNIFDGVPVISRDDSDVRFAKGQAAKNENFDMQNFKRKRGIPHKAGVLHEPKPKTNEEETEQKIDKPDLYPDEF